MSNRHGTAREIKDMKRSEAYQRNQRTPTSRQGWHRRMIAKHGGICPDVECCPANSMEE